MPFYERLGAAAAALADARPVDWSALAESATNVDERGELECLRVIDALARVHRSDDRETTRSVAGVQYGTAGAPAEAAAQWGRFRLLREVGSGSYGSVHLAWDPELEREVAIKILHHRVGDVDVRERVLHEGRALAKVDDPHVVQVLGLESFGDEIGLCMPFVNGDTLDARLQKSGVMSADEAALVGQDVCRALSAVHRAGFVHRDVKARNVMRDRMGRIVLMDFGTGQDLYRLTSADRASVAGTPAYMAPEVLVGRPATPASDVYSTGVLLYHLVTGSYPVVGRSVDELRAAHVQGHRTPIGERRPDLPLRFMQIVERAIAPRAEDRWPSAAALLEALGLFVADSSFDWETLLRRLALAGAGALGAGAVLVGLGAISSKYFNTFVLGRENFVDESIFEWMYWGALSLTAPLVLFMLAVLGLSLALVIRRLLLGVSASARRLDLAAARLARRLQLDDVSMASCWALVTASSVLAAAWWYCLPMLSMMIGLYPDDLSTASAEKLSFLGPEQFYPHEDYRVWFTWSTIVGGAVWVPVLRLSARRGQPVSRLMLLGGAVVFTLSLALLDLPFRAFKQGELETATWEGRPCYVLGENDTDVLVFCPGLAPPRSRPVPKDAAALRRLGVKEDVFTHIRSIS